MTRLYTILFLLLTAVLVAGFVFWRYFYLATITIDPVPSEATITLNGEPTPLRTFRLPKGTYVFGLSAPGFKSEKLTVNATYGSQLVKRVALVALPRPVKLLDGPIHSLVLAADKKTAYFSLNNVLSRSALEASPLIVEPITPALANIEKVTWSPDFQLALLKKTDGSTDLYDFNRYDLLHQTNKPLGEAIGEATWASDGRSIYHENKTPEGERTLAKANRAGQIVERLGDLRSLPFTKLQLLPANPTTLYIANSNLKEPGDILLFNLHERLITPLTDSTFAYRPVVSPDTIAYTDNGELVTASADGANKRNLVLRPQPGNYVFTDSNHLLVFTANKVTVVNTTDGAKEEYEVYAPSDSIDNLAISANSKTLYYLYDGNLYQLRFNEDLSIS